MPIFDYKCTKCGHEKELILKGDDVDKRGRRKCPECGKKTFERLVSAPAGFDLKGDGYYKGGYNS